MTLFERQTSPSALCCITSYHFPVQFTLQSLEEGVTNGHFDILGVDGDAFSRGRFFCWSARGGDMTKVCVSGATPHHKWWATFRRFYIGGRWGKQ